MDESNNAGREGGEADPPPAAGEVRFDGLIMANVSTFTMSPDRRIVSVLFDDFVLTRLPLAAGEEPETLDHRRRMVLALPAAARGKKVAAQVRGYWNAGGSDAAAAVTLHLGASAHPAALPGPEGDIYLDIEGATPAGEEALVVDVEALIPPAIATDGEVYLGIDSIDLSLLD